MKKIILLNFLILISFRPAFSQGEGPLAADGKTINSLMNALYEVISGPAGDRDWDRLKNLFLPNAPMDAIYLSPEGEEKLIQGNVDTYIEKSGTWLRENAFYESEAGRKTEIFDHIAMVFSAYEARHNPEEMPFIRGINTLQLVNYQGRWWIVSLLWNPERENSKIPKKYLKKQK